MRALQQAAVFWSKGQLPLQQHCPKAWSQMFRVRGIRKIIICRLSDIVLLCRWATMCIAQSWDITAARRTRLTCAKPCPETFTSAASKLGKTVYIQKS